MGVEKLFFSFSGRIDRSTWWIAQIVIGIAFAMVFFIFKMSLGTIAAVLAVVPFYWSITALNVKRLHDRGKSGWWLLTLAASGVLSSWSQLLMPFVASDPTFASLVLILAVLAIGIALWGLWVMIQMMFLVGKPGPNAYGQPPMLLIELFGREPVPPPAMYAAHTSVPRPEVAVSPVRHGGGLPRRSPAAEPLAQRTAGNAAAVAGRPARAGRPLAPSAPQGFGKRR